MTGIASGDDHDFHTLDRLTPTSTAGLSVGFAVPGRPSSVGGAIGCDLAAHYVHTSGVGAYLVVPASYVSVDGPNQKALGNAELGVLFSHRVTDALDMIGHIGVAYDYEHQGIAPLQYLAALSRYGDLVQRWGFTTWLRFGVSPMGHTGSLFWRADVGLDLMLDDHAGMGSHISPLVHAGLAGGIERDWGEATAELVSVITHPDGPVIDRAAGTLAVGGRMVAGRWRPGLAVILPLRFDLTPADRMDVGFSVSVTARLR